MKKLTVLASAYKAEKYIKYYLKSAASQTFKDFEIAIELVNPSLNELNILKKRQKKYQFINLNIQEEKISLPKAWNEAIKRTESELICIWNLDDIRTPESLFKMVEVFNDNNEIDFVYGNYIITNKFKNKKGNYIDVSGLENELKKGMILGPFFMFKRSILEKIGCFDEQLLSGADFDFAMKLARSGNGKHIDFNLGFYLNDRSGLSTNENSLQEIERTVVELRFGLNPLNKSLIEKAKKEYKI
jgi:cellulose synthase/poly-beta-1,6-N-acetylglucosamine synthase-like glycosyltransferase